MSQNGGMLKDFEKWAWSQNKFKSGVAIDDITNLNFSALDWLDRYKNMQSVQSQKWYACLTDWIYLDIWNSKAFRME